MPRRNVIVALAATLSVGVAAGLSTGATAWASPDADAAKPQKLTDGVAVERPLPGPEGHDYKAVTRTSFWSVVATDPTGVVDVDLSVADDRKHTDVLAESELAAGLVDFVAIDGNHRSPDTVFPRVTRHSGEGTYTVQLAQGENAFVGGTQSIPFSGSDVVQVRDTLLLAGTTYRFTLTPKHGSMRGALYLMDSLPLTVSTWVKPKSAAMDSAFAPPGQPVVMEVTVPRDDWYGLVITNEEGAGAFDLTRTTL